MSSHISLTHSDKHMGDFSGEDSTAEELLNLTTQQVNT